MSRAKVGPAHDDMIIPRPTAHRFVIETESSVKLGATMICSHITIVEKRVGAFGDCAICRLPVIWDGSSWVVRWSLSPHKITKLRRIGIVDRLIEKQGDL